MMAHRGYGIGGLAHTGACRNRTYPPQGGGRGLTEPERCANLCARKLHVVHLLQHDMCCRHDIAQAFRHYADIPAAEPRALSKHALSCALISILGYEPAAVGTAAHGVL